MDLFFSTDSSMNAVNFLGWGTQAQLKNLPKKANKKQMSKKIISSIYYFESKN